MTNPSRTNQELLEENSALKQEIRELAHSESEHKQEMEKLRESEGLFRSYLEYAPDGVYMSDRKATCFTAIASAKRSSVTAARN